MSKIIELISDEFNTLLFELFEANVNPYSWTRDIEPNLEGDNEYYYEFVTEDNDRYFVDAEKYGDSENSWTLNFNTEGYSYEATLNKGRLQKVMATIISIAKDLISNESPEKITISPSKLNPDDMRRFNLYMEYIKRHLPSNYDVTTNTNLKNPQIFLNRK